MECTVSHSGGGCCLWCLLSVSLSIAWAICFSFSSKIQVKSQTLEKEAKECRLRTEEWYVETWIPRGPKVKIGRPEFWSGGFSLWISLLKWARSVSSPGSSSVLLSLRPDTLLVRWLMCESSACRWCPRAPIQRTGCFLFQATLKRAFWEFQAGKLTPFHCARLLVYILNKMEAMGSNLEIPKS